MLPSPSLTERSRLRDCPCLQGVRVLCRSNCIYRTSKGKFYFALIILLFNSYKQADNFQSDIFPPALSAEPACDAAEFFSGKSFTPNYISLENGSSVAWTPSSAPAPAPAPLSRSASISVATPISAAPAPSPFAARSPSPPTPIPVPVPVPAPVPTHYEAPTPVSAAASEDVSFSHQVSYTTFLEISNTSLVFCTA